MGLLAVIAAAIATFAVGAVYYIVLAKPWMAAADIEVGEDGKPVSDGPLPYIVSFVCILLVAGMMRHTFALTNMADSGHGFIAGLGVGLFFISPWIFINTGYSNRPWKLALIDSGYATIGCGVMGLVLTLL